MDRVATSAWHDEGVDDALIAALRSGDRDAFAALVERETGPIYRTCARILGAGADAEDVAQETFVIAYRSLRGFRGTGSLRGWLLRIASRQAFRRLHRRRPAAPLDAVAEERVADANADPARVSVLRERHGSIRSTVASLPDPYREVVALRFFAELSLLEIAEATGRPLNTVKTHLRRGLERLRPLLGDEESPS
jgi:RNA polymerase sigma-70 factor (ECF subfamily)